MEERLSMKKSITFLVIGALCCATAASAAKHPPKKAPVLAAKNAAWACKAQRTTMGATAFVRAYGANGARGAGAMRNAFGKCVSQKTRLFNRARLFESATGSLTAAAAVGTHQAVTMTATIGGARPIASGSLTAALSVDLGMKVTKAGTTCAPASGTLTLTQASPAGTLQKTLTSATYCTGPGGAALVGKFTLTGTGAFAGKTGTGTEVILAPAGGSAHSIEWGSIS
jgi:hypothetical protein